MQATLYYVHDPMCSWCWGFNPALSSLLDTLPSAIRVHRVLGGLAPDSDQPMPADMQAMLQKTWRHIQSVIPGTEFNFDFWTQNQPRRSTWPACRAVIAAKNQSPAFECPMIEAIQQAYYLHAENPSDTDTLVALASAIGCNADEFSEALHHESTQHTLRNEIALSQHLRIQGFPGLALVVQEHTLYPIAVNYQQPSQMLEQIEKVYQG